MRLSQLFKHDFSYKDFSGIVFHYDFNSDFLRISGDAESGSYVIGINNPASLETQNGKFYMFYSTDIFAAENTPLLAFFTVPEKTWDKILADGFAPLEIT